MCGFGWLTLGHQAQYTSAIPEVRFDTVAAIRGKHASWRYRLRCKRDKPLDLAA